MLLDEHLQTSKVTMCNITSVSAAQTNNCFEQLVQMGLSVPVVFHFLTCYWAFLNNVASPLIIA